MRTTREPPPTWDVAGFSGRGRPRSSPDGTATGAAASSKSAPPPAAAGASRAAAAPSAPDAASGGGGGGAAGSATSSDTEPAGPSLSGTAAYLESLFGSSYAAAQPEIDIEHCYRVLEGCPWLVPRPVYVLTLGELRQRGAAAAADGGERFVGSTYTLRTKVVQKGAADQLAKMLGKPHLASAFEVAHMRDGVVAFETPDAAARYATRLEEEGETKVTVAEVDSHALFRLSSDAKGLVVLVSEGDGGELPAPFQLAAALKGQRAWDDL